MLKGLLTGLDMEESTPNLISSRGSQGDQLAGTCREGPSNALAVSDPSAAADTVSCMAHH